MNDKEFFGLKKLQDDVEVFEERAKIKNKERELKERVKKAKKSIRGDSFLDKLLGTPGPRSGDRKISYDDIFNERPREVVQEVVHVPKQKLAKKVNKKRVIKNVVKDDDDFIMSEFDNEDFDKELEESIKGLGI